MMPWLSSALAGLVFLAAQPSLQSTQASRSGSNEPRGNSDWVAEIQHAIREIDTKIELARDYLRASDQRLAEMTNQLRPYEKLIAQYEEEQKALIAQGRFEEAKRVADKWKAIRQRGQPLFQATRTQIELHETIEARLQRLQDLRAKLLERLFRRAGEGANGKVNWSSGSAPPANVAKAVADTLNDPAWPKAVRTVLSQVNFKWLNRPSDIDRLPGRPSNIRTSVWFFNEVSLAIGPGFKTKVDGKTGEQQERPLNERRNLVAFELGKMIRENLKKQSHSLAAEFQQDADTLPARLRRLPGVPDLSAAEEDAPSVFGYAYYYFIFDQESLRKAGAGKLIDKWNANPPHGFVKFTFTR